MYDQSKFEQFIHKLEEFIDARLDQKFREYLNAFKFDALRQQLSGESLPVAATTFLQAIVEGHIPASIAERARLCRYALDKVKTEDISYEAQILIERVQRVLLEQQEHAEQTSLEDEQIEPLDNSTLEFLTLKAANIYSLELVALAYTHRDYAQLIESGYEELDETPTINQQTGTYNTAQQAKLDYVAGLRVSKIAYTQLETTRAWSEHAELEINDAGEIRPRTARNEQGI